MADRLTQLQDAVNQMADHFCNSVGVLQQSAQTSSFPATDKNSTTIKPDATPNEDYARLFSKLIARTAKDVDVLIDSLPSEESSAELQVASLKRLEEENQQAAKKLESIVSMGESLLGTVQEALHDIANSQLKSKALECGDT